MLICENCGAQFAPWAKKRKFRRSCSKVCASALATRLRWQEPGYRERMSQAMKARAASDQFKAHCGQLTSSERAEVVKQIRAGDKYMDIALDWLISEDRVQDIASEEGIYRRADKLREAAASRDRE